MKRNSKKLLAFLSATLLILFLWFGFQNEWSASCWAYPEQCSADRISGLTQEECGQRSDMVAYLLEENICLVKAKRSQ